jgi:alkylation response protein AidB-like acyl-CoA dehydrogenase
MTVDGPGAHDGPRSRTVGWLVGDGGGGGHEAADFSAVHDELRAVAREVLGKGAAPTTAQLAELGWLGLEVPEDLFGSGATFAEVAVVLEELGRAAAPTPYLGTAVLGVGLLHLIEPSPGRDALLRLVAQGQRTLAVALPTGSFRLAGGRLSGRAEMVVDAPTADRLLVPVADGGEDGSPVVVVLHTGAEAPPALEVVERPVVDGTRRLGDVVADGIEVDERAVWRLQAGADLQHLADRAALAVAIDALGVAAAMVDATVAYAKVRHQFGRAIGSFQAVKHACADMLVQVTVARELTNEAVRALASGDPTTSRAVSMAKAYATSAAVEVAGKAVQLHGGIGYTWESGIHAFLKRAALDRALFGDPAAHRRHLAEHAAGC